jgi:hypothetical protein
LIDDALSTFDQSVSLDFPHYLADDQEKDLEGIEKGQDHSP